METSEETYTTISLTKREKIALKLIPTGLNQTQIAKQLNIGKSAVSKMFKRFKQKGIIKKEVRSARNFWEVSYPGKLLLGVPVESFLSPESYRFHNLQVVIPIIQQTEDFKDVLLNNSYELTKRRNYKGYQRRFNHGLVFFGKNVLYYPNEIWANSPDDCLNKLVKQAQEVRIYLEATFNGLRLGYPDERGAFKLVNQHMALLGGPADAFAQGTPPATGERCLIDSSKGTPEIEAHHPLYAKDDMERLVKFFDKVVTEDILDKDQVARMLEATAITLSSHQERLKKLEGRI